MLRLFFARLMMYLWPPRLFAGLSRILLEWQRSDVRNKGLLLLVFSPMLLCLIGLLISVASFVLFVLPSFVLRLLGWLLLTSLFGGGGLYFYERLKGGKPPRASSKEEPYDVSAKSQDSVSKEKTASPPSGSDPKQSETTHTWYENVRDMKRRR